MRIKIFAVILFFLCTPLLYAQDVDTAWARRYNGPANGSDASGYLAIDDSGNVYVTGYSEGSGTDYDYATIKYYPNGDTAWVRRYNGLENGNDGAWPIVVDDSGNVYVTGGSFGSDTTDYATIKYYSNGDTAWVRRYNGPGNGADWTHSIAVDDSGNVYVAGDSYGSGTDRDYATIKYYSNGDTAWVRRYNGLGNWWDGARAMAVDKFGNVYVTGYSHGSGTYYDYATIKYFPNGDTAWVRRYNEPVYAIDEASAIVVDSSGNVYVTGGSQGDYATIKYCPNGDTGWVRRYDGPNSGTDIASAIAVDNSGNVYVTGKSDSSGLENPDYVTIKYYPNGNTAWVRRYNGPGNFHDRSWSIAVDDSGNVYAIGESYGNGTNFDYAIIKYYPNGDTAWVKRYNGPNNDQDMGYDIVVDDSGNVYVTGFSIGIGTSWDYATIKYIQFLRGDANDDGELSIADIIYLINYLFRGGPPPNPIQSGDANCDGEVRIGDIIYLINYLFRGGPPPGC